MRRRELKLWFISAVISAACFSTVRAAQNGSGAITGMVRLNGKAPPPAIYQPDHGSEVCGNRPRVAQSLLLGTNQCVQNVIVYLDQDVSVVKARFQGNTATVLDQRECEFVPRIQIGRSGARLILRNSDPILHVVRIDSLSATNQPKTLLTVATPYAGFEKKYQLANFREPTLLRVGCGNGHKWMAAYIAVMPHPWAALSDANGKFTLRDLPAGTHKLYAWHEVLGTLTREVKVPGGRTVTVDLEFVSAQ